jgi:hypothetical protein
MNLRRLEFREGLYVLKFGVQEIGTIQNHHLAEAWVRRGEPKLTPEPPIAKPLFHASPISQPSDPISALEQRNSKKKPPPPKIPTTREQKKVEQLNSPFTHGWQKYEDSPTPQLFSPAYGYSVLEWIAYRWSGNDYVDVLSADDEYDLMALTVGRHL